MSLDYSKTAAPDNEGVKRDQIKNETADNMLKEFGMVMDEIKNKKGVQLTSWEVFDKIYRRRIK